MESRCPCPGMILEAELHIDPSADTTTTMSAPDPTPGTRDPSYKLFYHISDQMRYVQLTILIRFSQ